VFAGALQPVVEHRKLGPFLTRQEDLIDVVRQACRGLGSFQNGHIQPQPGGRLQADEIGLDA
jgi:hypothetical protein